MDFKQIVMSRYATKKFSGEKIPLEKIDELKELIRYAPSSFNMQTWKIKVIEDMQTKQKLLEATWNQPQVTTCSHLLVFCADKDLPGIIDKMHKELLKSSDESSIRGYIDMMNGFVKNMSDEDMLNYAKNQVFIALGNAINGAKSLGFDSCPMGGFNPLQYSKILKLPDNLVPTVLCAVGVAADTPRPKWRFDDIFF